MKIVIVATRTGDPDAIAPLLQGEAQKALKLVASDFIREIYSRKDGEGAILIVEASSEEEARERLQSLPLVQNGLLSLDIYEVGPYRGFVAAANA